MVHGKVVCGVVAIQVPLGVGAAVRYHVADGLAIRVSLQELQHDNNDKIRDKSAHF